MRFFLGLMLVFTSTAAQAFMPISTKERLKLEMWVEGVEVAQVSQATSPLKQRAPKLPEEITVILNKFKL